MSQVWAAFEIKFRNLILALLMDYINPSSTNALCVNFTTLLFPH